MVRTIEVDGDNLLYHFFQRELASKDTPYRRILISKMLANLSVWLPVELYERLPVIFPFAVRDSSCRKSVNKNREEWGSCDSRGYFRDDNTLIKGIPRRFKITSENKEMNGARMGKGFIASHIWRKLPHSSDLTTKNPLTYSFVPNVVWLPRQISKLTDREGSFAQRYLQALSIAIYNRAVLSPQIANFVDPIWGKLVKPQGITMEAAELSGLNFFNIEIKDADEMVAKLLKQINMINSHSLKNKLFCSRYLVSYCQLSNKIKSDFEEDLFEYAQVLR